MEFRFETLRMQHPQASLIPRPLWISIFNEELTEHQLTLRQSEPMISIHITPYKHYYISLL